MPQLSVYVFLHDRDSANDHVWSGWVRRKSPHWSPRLGQNTWKRFVGIELEVPPPQLKFNGPFWAAQAIVSRNCCFSSTGKPLNLRGANGCRPSLLGYSEHPRWALPSIAPIQLRFGIKLEAGGFHRPILFDRDITQGGENNAH